MGLHYINICYKFFFFEVLFVVLFFCVLFFCRVHSAKEAKEAAMPGRSSADALAWGVCGPADPSVTNSPAPTAAVVSAAGLSAASSLL